MKIIKERLSQNGKSIQLIEQSPQNYYKTVLVIGVTHGDEPQGKFLIENYLGCPPPQPSPSGGEGECLQSKNVKNNLETFSDFERRLPPPLRGRDEFHNEERVIEIQGGGQKNRLLFIPCLNPDGLELKTRQNFNEIDINRNFPTKNWEREPFASEYFGGEECASEIETKFVMEVLEEYNPDIILTLHAPYKVVNYDGPAEGIALKISEIIGYQVTSDIGYPTPGSFGNYAGIERNIPTITLELDEEIDVNELVKPMNKVFDLLKNI